jgi:collagen type III alpha
LQNSGSGTTNRNNMKIKHVTTVALALGLSVLGALAQDDGPPQNPPPDAPSQGPPDGQPPQGGPRRGMHRPLPAIFVALDTNHDGVIDADEIANAPAALKTLDKKGDGQLTLDEIMGPRPHRGMGPGQGPDGGPPPEAANGGTNGPDGNGMPPQGGPGWGMRRPLPPIFQALDTNHDGVISADEIANASAALKTLDKNGDGKLNLFEVMGPPPQRRGMGPGQGQGQGFGPGPGQGPPDGEGPGPDGPPDGGPDDGQMPPPEQQ